MFVAGDDGRSVATAETVGVVVDADGSVVTARPPRFRCTGSGPRERGRVTYTLLIPVPKPGGYELGGSRCARHAVGRRGLGL